jgi:predicted dehydrogenase
VTLRIGILGAATVATYAMIDAAKDVDGVVVQAVAARDPERAKAYAAQHGIPKVYDDYAALIAADDVDAIYNALPPHLHVQWSIAAVKAGKPVLCEKPFALSIADVEVMLEAEARTGVLIMEAQHSHYHPLSARMRDVVRSGVLGTIGSFSGSFVAPLNLAHDDLRNIGSVGGGALWDLGVYPAYWIRSAFGEEPTVLSATHRLNDRGADMETTAQLQLPSGATGTLTCNMEAEALGVWLSVEGEKGRLVVTNPLSPQRMHRFALTMDGQTDEETFTTRPTYAYQLEAFRDAVVDGASVATRGGDSLATIKLLSDIKAKAEQEQSDGR